MNRWLLNLRLLDVWPEKREEGQPTAELAVILARRIRLLKDLPDPALNAEKERIAKCFDNVAAKGDRATYHQFNRAMSDLYDWGDQRTAERDKVCWVGTAF